MLLLACLPACLLCPPGCLSSVLSSVWSCVLSFLLSVCAVVVAVCRPCACRCAVVVFVSGPFWPCLVLSCAVGPVRPGGWPVCFSVKLLLRLVLQRPLLCTCSPAQGTVGVGPGLAFSGDPDTDHLFVVLFSSLAVLQALCTWLRQSFPGDHTIRLGQLQCWRTGLSCFRSFCILSLVMRLVV